MMTARRGERDTVCGAGRLAGVVAVLALVAAGCTHHTVKVEPIEVKPIHMTVDVNIKVDRELDQFFAFEDEIDVPVDDDEDPDEGANR